MNAKRLLLPASLALNVFLAVLAFQHWRADGPLPPPLPPGEIVEKMAATLPPADGAILREVFARHAGGLEMGRPGRDGVIERLGPILLAPEFDAAALRQIFTDGRRRREGFDRVLEEAVVESLSRISPDGRARIAEWERRHRPPGRP
jgi:uncharacterized membrane protein